LRRGLRPRDLTLVEMGGEFAKILAARYPEATILQRDAARLPAPDPATRLHGAAISGLPLLSMPQAKVLRILRGAFRLLEAGAGFYQFTYGRRCPVPDDVLDRLRLRARRIGTARTNLPPATVYRLEPDRARAA
jgi:phospholipid N-methyltransferase